jgi:hypothetical protein
MDASSVGAIGPSVCARRLGDRRHFSRLVRQILSYSLPPIRPGVSGNLRCAQRGGLIRADVPGLRALVISDDGPARGAVTWFLQLDCTSPAAIQLHGYQAAGFRVAVSSANSLDRVGLVSSEKTSWNPIISAWYGNRCDHFLSLLWRSRIPKADIVSWSQRGGEEWRLESCLALAAIGGRRSLGAIDEHHEAMRRRPVNALERSQSSRRGGSFKSAWLRSMGRPESRRPMWQTGCPSHHGYPGSYA